MAKNGTLRKRALNACTTYTASHREVGALLAEIQAKQLFKQWDHETFAAYCETELGISRTKGNRLAGVADALDAAGHDEPRRIRLGGRVVGRDAKARPKAAREDARCRPEVWGGLRRYDPLARAGEAVGGWAEGQPERTHGCGHEHRSWRKSAPPERLGKGDVVGEPPGSEKQGGRGGADPLDLRLDGGGCRRIGHQRHGAAQAAGLGLGPRSDGGRKPARPPTQDENRALRHPPKRRDQVAARWCQDAHEGPIPPPVEIVRRTTVVPERHATRLGYRCDSPP